MKSDLMLRQYSRGKSRSKKSFSYRELKSVYTIVLIENSSQSFHQIPGCYLHRSRQTFDTGLQLNLLQEYIFIALGVFLKMTYTVEEEIEAWLLFLSSNQTEDIMRIIEKYPYFRELYKETAKFQIKPEELVGMYSEVLEMMDRNTVQYMIDEQQQVIERQKKLMAEKELQIQEKDSQLREKEAENNRLKKLLKMKV